VSECLTDEELDRCRSRFGTHLGEPPDFVLVQRMITEIKQLRAEVERLERDARRYWRLRVLGCAPSNSTHLRHGLVQVFTNLDAHVDADIAAHPSRGEAEHAALTAKGVGK